MYYDVNKQKNNVGESISDCARNGEDEFGCHSVDAVVDDDAIGGNDRSNEDAIFNERGLCITPSIIITSSLHKSRQLFRQKEYLKFSFDFDFSAVLGHGFSIHSFLS